MNMYNTVQAHKPEKDYPLRLHKNAPPTLHKNNHKG